jgi:hypothetical protein
MYFLSQTVGVVLMIAMFGDQQLFRVDVDYFGIEFDAYSPLEKNVGNGPK